MQKMQLVKGIDKQLASKLEEFSVSGARQLMVKTSSHDSAADTPEDSASHSVEFKFNWLNSNINDHKREAYMSLCINWLIDQLACQSFPKSTLHYCDA